MKLVLRQLNPGGATEDYVFAPPGPVLIGRGSDCGVRLDDPCISRHHCSLTHVEGRWQLEDLRSRNGTRLNGRKVQRADLSDGDTLALGDARFRVRLVDPGATSGAIAKRVEAAPKSEPADQPEPARTQISFASGGAAPPASRNQPNLLGRRYELGPLVHQGSTGVFYRATDTRSGQAVCVKVLAASVTDDEAELKRFVRGVQTAAKLHHPNIVQLHRAGRSREGKWWLAMEHVDGLSLRQAVARYGVGHMLGAARVLAVARDVVSALEVAYERQVLHRNIKPDNILFTKAGMAKLSDFSLARGVVLTTLQRITTASDLVGDLAYMAPERCEPDGLVDCRSDIYALGACLYALLAGRPPFAGRGMVDLIDKIRHEPAVPLSRVNLSVPGPLEGIVMKCLAKSPTERFQSPMELREELARVARFQGLWT